MDVPPPPDNPVDTGRAVPAQRPVDAPYPRGPFTPPPPPAIFPPGSTPPASTPPASTPPGGFVPLQPSPSPPGLRGRRPRRKRNWRLIIAVLVGVVAALCASGSLVAYVAYDKATTPDRSTPEVAVRQYAQAYLGDHDDARAALFACSDKSALTAVKAFRQDLDNREKKFHFTINVSLDSVREASRSGNTAHVTVAIVLFTNDNGQQLYRVEHWDFTAVRTDDWRVCGGHQVS